jgi:hypothetical protein
MAKRQAPNGGRGRPKGVKNRVSMDVRLLAQNYSEEAIYTLVKAMRGEHKKGEEPVAHATRLYAASLILDRGYGKPPQACTGEGGTGPVTINLIDELHPVEERQTQ